MTPVTKSFIPPLEEYQAQVKRSFDNQWLTNRGELVNECKVVDNQLLIKEKRLIVNIYF